MVSPEVAKYGLDPWGLLFVPIPLIVLVAITLPLRLWVRFRFTRKPGWDDWLLIVSSALFFLECACLMAVGHVQLTKGITEPVIELGVLNFAGIAAYVLAQATFKLSMAFFFFRIVIERWQRWLIIISVAVYVQLSLAVLFIFLFQCGDPAKLTLNGTAGSADTPKCLDFASVLEPVFYVYAALNVVVDWLFATIPIVVIRKLQMDRKDKYSAIFVIVLACSASTISLVRLPFVDGLNPMASYYSSASNRIAYTSVAETGVGIAAASLATTRPLLRAWRDRARSIARSTRKSDKSAFSSPSGKTPIRREQLLNDNLTPMTDLAQSWDSYAVSTKPESVRSPIIPDIEDSDEESMVPADCHCHLAMTQVAEVKKSRIGSVEVHVDVP
ncbi:hypothetical protein AAFC00_005688 [Neodothiora populina]|uniref:Rhodopsin domain-containing protein n=1 Tax=Neodothiora populina TaxID=2781224 RepID=A0ABR3P6T8_9PEZI